jgi:hypothetical protein
MNLSKLKIGIKRFLAPLDPKEHVPYEIVGAGVLKVKSADIVKTYAAQEQIKLLGEFKMSEGSVV